MLLASRGEPGETLAEFAGRAGISVRRLQDLRSGACGLGRTRLRTVTRIARALGVTPDVVADALVTRKIHRECVRAAKKLRRSTRRGI